jgi:hypothetical protein
MPSQNDIKNSSPSAAPVQSATRPTPTAPAKPAATATTSSASRFREGECILLVLSPTGTVHPVVNKPGGAGGVRIFESAEAAAVEQQTNPRLVNFQFAILPLKDLF